MQKEPSLHLAHKLVRTHLFSPESGRGDAPLLNMHMMSSKYEPCELLPPRDTKMRFQRPLIAIQRSRLFLARWEVAEVSTANNMRVGEFVAEGCPIPAVSYPDGSIIRGFTIILTFRSTC